MMEVTFVNIDEEETESESHNNSKRKLSKQESEREFKRSKFDHIPQNSGYHKTVSTIKTPSVSPPKETKTLESLRRMLAWSFLDTCPRCGSQDLFKYMDGTFDRYYVQCSNIANSIYKEIDCLCRGMIYEVPVRMKNSGEIPLSHQVKSLEEYVEKVQDRICGWHVSM